MQPSGVFHACVSRHIFPIICFADGLVRLVELCEAFPLPALPEPVFVVLHETCDQCLEVIFKLRVAGDD